MYAEHIPESAVLLHLECEDRDDVLQRIAEALAAQDPALADRAEELCNALRDRESEGSTGQQGVAIPHVKLSGIETIRMVVAVVPGGVEFAALDGAPVKVLFGVVRPAVDDPAAQEEHLAVLRWIAGIASHQDFVNFACQAKTPRQVVELLSELAPQG